ncbi:amino acid adenylation domain-containing protein [Pseudobacteriovorax antillogorgiicola]|uniref:Amino acid adenylation domain-containing protein n=1 Tax=Pseudobacteriovorax antillogorgiicola TaxID=1513793 RepID=A0A1Y6B6K4_9BACT|nr:amino acid adenylation domain-containing protein [Pseudobacteriovorax antillogorgiicola]TCS58780.1 amino acid adenylation domain-containing protein [Pseudobacteriovorax antillogorgiicola]SME94801.1 amino acid adenylation domain-containing protein [Pseudobacteriovorax antillogorgiicola]
MQETISQKTTICNLMEHQASRTPELIAIIDGELEISYHQLLQRSRSIANEIRDQGIEPGSLVGLCMNRGWEMAAAMIGILQAGSAYVPLDPKYPRERVRFMLEHSKASAVIVDRKVSSDLCQGVPCIIYTTDIKQLDPVTQLPPTQTDDLAYVIYTSGSTGHPKGVAVEHRSLVALSQAMSETLSSYELGGVLASTSICFDPSVMEILGTLSLGGTVVIVENILDLLEYPGKHQIKTCVAVPSAVQAVLQSNHSLPSIACYVLGGEALKPSLVKQLQSLSDHVRIINVYGPTEDTVFSTVKEIKSHKDEITIGTSVANSCAYILDKSLEPVAKGQEGELYLAGDKLARGYLYDDSKTRERFIEVNVNETFKHSRLYRSGDLCRWNSNDELVFLGRIDQQVKVRGFRIEIEEVESCLESIEGVARAAVTIAENPGGQSSLTAYIVPKHEALGLDEIRNYLKERLPHYMVPHRISAVQSIPVMPNGKLDRNGIAEMESGKDNDPQILEVIPSSAPVNSDAMMRLVRNNLESLIGAQRNRFSPDHTFDDLGLDSLTRLEFLNRISHSIGRVVSLSEISAHNTPSTFSNFLSNTVQSTDEGDPRFSKPILETLTSFQIQVQASYPTFQIAKSNSWSASDKAKLICEYQDMMKRHGEGSYSRVLKTGSGTKGVVVDKQTGKEQESIIWSTNLYLGLNRDPEIIASACSAIDTYGSGMGTSAAASGVTDIHLEFETAFAELVGKESACLFPTGYTANVGVVAGLLGENDVVVIDQLSHASIVDGARLCGAEVRTFKHNSAQDLASVLKAVVSPYRTVLVVIEGVYSMGEGAAPVAEIVQTAKQHGALVLVDEAHSFGFYGDKGAGICAAQGISHEADFIMTTLSKAMGSLGGVVACSREHAELLKASARAYIFQASVSPADIAAALAALRRLSHDADLRQRLWDTTRYMRRRFQDAGYDLGTGDGPIVTPHFKDKDKLFTIVDELFKQGIQTSAVTYPIVESGRGRLRFICSAAHTREDVDKTLEALIEAEKLADLKMYETDNRVKFLSDHPTVLQKFRLWLPRFAEHVIALNTEHQKGLDLDLRFIIPDCEPIGLCFRQGTYSLEVNGDATIPCCAISFDHIRYLETLYTHDISEFLFGISKGNCLLKGQTEAFVWLVGRLAEFRKNSHNSQSSE